MTLSGPAFRRVAFPRGQCHQLKRKTSAVGGDAHIAPREMLHFCARLRRIRLHARADVGIGPYGAVLS